MSPFDETYIKKLQDDARALIIDKVVQALVEKKKSHNEGVLCRYAVNSAISCLAANNIQVNRNFHVKRLLVNLRNSATPSLCLTMTALLPDLRVSLRQRKPRPNPQLIWLYPSLDHHARPPP